MDKFDHIILMRKILKNKKIQAPLNINLGTFAHPLKYNRMGEPISEELWQVLIKENEYFQVALDEFDDFKIFTVWTGIDGETHKTDNARFIFQTIFIKDEKPLHYSYLYPTESVAFKNHQKLVFMADQKMLHEYMES